jgi:transcriptional regulator with XRE-family HTH domain
MPPTTAAQTIEVNGYALRAIRTALGIDIRLLSDQLECDRTRLVKLELGQSTRMRPALYRALVTALGVDYRALLANPYGVTDDEVAS